MAEVTLVLLNITKHESNITCVIEPVHEMLIQIEMGGGEKKIRT